MDEVAHIAQAVTFQRGTNLCHGRSPRQSVRDPYRRVGVPPQRPGREQVLRYWAQGTLGNSLFSHTPMSDFSEALEEGTMCVIAEIARTDVEVPPDRLQVIGRDEQAIGANLAAFGKHQPPFCGKALGCSAP